jgi:hypothetical protein
MSYDQVHAALMLAPLIFLALAIAVSRSSSR